VLHDPRRESGLVLEQRAVKRAELFAETHREPVEARRACLLRVEDVAVLPFCGLRERRALAFDAARLRGDASHLLEAPAVPGEEDGGRGARPVGPRFAEF
jgi:hypothetical protein